MSGGEDSRVSNPNNVRKTILEIKKTVGSKHSDDFIYTLLKDCGMDPKEASQRLKMVHDIREIAGKHSDDDVYTMLKECNLDPNEAAQRLLYIDTFHVVKKKRDRRKTLSNDASEEYRQPRGNPPRGARGVRGTYNSSTVSDDAGSGRAPSSGRGYGVAKPSERLSRSAMPVHPETENNIPTLATSSIATVNGTAAVANGNLNHKLVSELSVGVSSCTSDPVVVLSQNTRKTCSVGTIKCEIVNHRGSSGPKQTLPAGIRSNAGQVVAGAGQVAAETVDSNDGTRQLKYNVVDKSQLPDSSQSSLSLAHNSLQTVNSNQDGQPPQLLNESQEVVASEAVTAVIADSKSLPTKASEFKGSTPKFDVMLEKLKLTSHKPVIFPDHLQVPETFKGLFTFGSLDATLNDSGSISVTESLQGNIEVVTEPSLSSNNVTSSAQEDEFKDHPPRPLHVSDKVLPSQDNNSSDSAAKHEHLKQDIMAPLGGIQNPLLQDTRDYSLGLMPHLLGPHLVQLDVPEHQNGSSLVSSTSGPTPATQPAAAGQSSLALTPPVFPYFRPTYPPYFQYNPYFPPMYLPQNAHLLGHGVYPQQTSAGTAYVPPAPATAAAAAAAGLKFPDPSQYKQGNGAGSLTHLGFPSGYGAYASSSVGYGAAVTPGSSPSEDLTTSQTKENNLYSAVQQGEDPQVWAPAPGRDITNLLPNYFFNFPQGQHLAFSPPQAGLYHSSQTMAAQSTVQPPMHQPQSTGGTVESMVPTSSSYQQPQMNWNAALLNREAI